MCGALRIRILNNYESESGIEAIVTVSNKYCGHIVLWSDE